MKKLFLVLLNFCALGAKLCREKRTEKMKTNGKDSYNSKIFGKNVAGLVGSYLEPQSAAKMKLTNKSWSKIDVYENYFPDDNYAFLTRHKETEELVWNDPTDLIHRKDNLLDNLKRNDSGKWYYLFERWFYEQCHVYSGDLDNIWHDYFIWKKTTLSFGKSLLLVIAENIDVAIGERGVLHVAAHMGDEKSLRKLLNRGASVDKLYIRDTALKRAIYYRNETCCRILLENGADVNLSCMQWECMNPWTYADAYKYKVYTPLMYAAQQGFVNIVKLLLENGADKKLSTPLRLLFRHPYTYAIICKF